MKFNKLKDESGSAMLLAIFLVVLVSIVMVSFSTQVGNQIKSTMRADENIVKKYQAEGKIEEELGNFISNLNISTFKYKENEFDINSQQLTGYKIEYNKGNCIDVEPIVKRECIIESNSKYIKVKENTDVDFEIIIKESNSNRDISGKKFKYNDIYTIKSEILVKIRNLKTDKAYSITYDVNTWDKVN